ncbi:hypothetical protein NUITMVR1_02510 [Raoultella ornithinolytica]|nr:hypothetical protein NUITMVR1_02510 [Raoultella ornithinolytica]
MGNARPFCPTSAVASEGALICESVPEHPTSSSDANSTGLNCLFKPYLPAVLKPMRGIKDAGIVATVNDHCKANRLK